jgi:L-asparaginase
MPKRGKIALVVAGGQIGLKTEEDSGHQPFLSGETMLSWLPEDMSQDVFLVDWSHQPSSHYSIRMTTDLIQILNKLIIEGVDGIVVSSGTDTLEEMAYLTDLFWAYPQPVIFTAATLPFDVPGTDAIINLTQAMYAASSQKCWGLGVLVCLQDQLFAASEITEETNHRRSAFVSPDRGPLGEIIGQDIQILRIHKRSKVLEGDHVPARNVELIYANLGGGELLIKLLSEAKDRDLDGLVIAGFGDGTISPSWIPFLRKIIRDGIPVVISSRCFMGRTRRFFNFEGSLNKLLELGVYDGGNLRPLQARLKLSAGLGAGLKGSELQKFLYSQ